MRKRIIICILIIFALSALAFFFFYFYEIVKVNRSMPPIPEYYSNDYLVLERWFNEAGISVKTTSYTYDYASIKEKTVIYTNINRLFYDRIEEEFLDWVKKGRNAVICISINNLRYLEKDASDFLSNLGITAGTTPIYYFYSNKDTPDYHWRYKFTVEDGRNYKLYYDIYNNIRIIRIQLGAGILTIMGEPEFMHNYYLKKEANARLTWELLGKPMSGLEDGTERKGVLFADFYKYENAKKSLFGALIQRGNIIPVITSILLLIIFGFWSVIPIFGLIKKDRETNARPIKERFTAEISFLKKYNGLYYYDDAINKIRGENDEKNKS